MSLFIYIGWQRQADKSVLVKCVYAGEDGAAGQGAWDEAIADGSMVRGKRFIEPTGGGSLPIDPTPTRSTKPTFITKARPVHAPRVADPLKSIADHEQKTRDERSVLEKQRLARLAMTGDGPDATKPPSSPTIEEYVNAGYPAEAYPPSRLRRGRQPRPPILPRGSGEAEARSREGRGRPRGRAIAARRHLLRRLPRAKRPQRSPRLPKLKPARLPNPFQCPRSKLQKLPHLRPLPQSPRLRQRASSPRRNRRPTKINNMKSIKILIASAALAVASLSAFAQPYMVTTVQQGFPAATTITGSTATNFTTTVITSYTNVTTAWSASSAAFVNTTNITTSTNTINRAKFYVGRADLSAGHDQINR
jgi:hypothetical protein